MADPSRPMDCHGFTENVSFNVKVDSNFQAIRRLCPRIGYVGPPPPHFCAPGIKACALHLEVPGGYKWVPGRFWGCRMVWYGMVWIAAVGLGFDVRLSFL